MQRGIQGVAGPTLLGYIPVDPGVLAPRYSRPKLDICRCSQFYDRETYMACLLRCPKGRFGRGTAERRIGGT